MPTITAVLRLLVLATLAFASRVSASEALASEVASRQHARIDALLLSRDGRLIASGRRPGLKVKSVDIRSATKSVTALLVGIAIERGHIDSVDAKVSELLPELSGAFDDPRRAAMTVRDLLTMRSGLDCDDWLPGSPGHEDTMYEQPDWLAFWSKVPMRDAPGTRFAYCTGNVIALGRILAQRSGEPVSRFAQRVLFGPMGIDDARWATWNAGRDTDTGGHLSLSPESLLAIGELVLAEGQWRGQPLVGKDWIAEMTQRHTDIPGRKQGYGYLWWLDETSTPSLPRTRLLMAWGNGGNFIVVMPELSAVYVTVGRRYNQPDALEPLHWLRDRILPTFVASGRTRPP
jgi:CubicO group peptidase (beta-lactamase class C family)